jgi:2-polyprenyl-3-methyl-5-hydroxy-6-metoxy-1,4-benzoquinol methylase
MKKNELNLTKKRMTFEVFKEMASEYTLSKYEKIGFPDSYREGYENKIFENIKAILKLDRKDLTFFDIGCGCSDLPNMIINHALQNDHNLYLIDSKEMLDQLHDEKNIFKLSAKFPNEIDLENYVNSVDVILVYSVLQHIILDMNPFYFLDKAVALLKDGGRLLIGDIPNISKRNRFFASENGLKFHQEFTKSDTKPSYEFNTLIEEKADDSLIFAILMRYRNAGFETYLLEQPTSLPLANRREDILIVRN